LKISAPVQNVEKCKSCGLPLEGESASIQGNEFHIKCFICTGCKKELKVRKQNNINESEKF